VRVVVLAILLASAVTLAGCSSPEAEQAKTPSAGKLPALHGWVFDAALRPLKGVTVKVLDTNSSTTTNDEGFYGFDGLPIEQFLVVVATKELFKVSSKQVTLTDEFATRLNFTLEQVPVKRASTEVRKFDGYIPCQGEVAINDQPYRFDCNAQIEQALNVFQFTVNEDLAGAVIEILWKPQTPVSESMGAKLETLNLGELNVVLGEVVGSSPLRIQVPEAVAKKYYVAGGVMRLTVHAESNGDEVESGIGASVMVRQTFQAFATLCHVLPPHPAYSFAGGSADCQKSA
jgi:hypothetical protein